jgi:hypothetical protein
MALSGHAVQRTLRQLSGVKRTLDGTRSKPATKVTRRRYLPEARSHPGDIAMRILAIMTAGMLLLAVSSSANAGPFSPVGPSTNSITLVQLTAPEQKSETVTQKLKRAWKNLVGYKFDVSCPFAGSRTCSETGASRTDAHSKCIAQNFGCWVSDAD